MKKIQSIDTETLRIKHDKLTELYESLSADEQRLTEQLALLSNAWKGKAANTFFANAAEDMTFLKSFVAATARVRNDYSMAIAEYSRFEQRADELFSSIILEE